MYRLSNFKMESSNVILIGKPKVTKSSKKRIKILSINSITILNGLYKVNFPSSISIIEPTRISYTIVMLSFDFFSSLSVWFQFMYISICGFSLFLNPDFFNNTVVWCNRLQFQLLSSLCTASSIFITPFLNSSTSFPLFAAFLPDFFSFFKS